MIGAEAIKSDKMRPETKPCYLGLNLPKYTVVSWGIKVNVNTINIVRMHILNKTMSVQCF